MFRNKKHEIEASIQAKKSELQKLMNALNELNNKVDPGVYNELVSDHIRLNDVYKSLIATGRFGWYRDHGDGSLVVSRTPTRRDVYSTALAEGDRITAQPFEMILLNVPVERAMEQDGTKHNQADCKLSDVMRMIPYEFLTNVGLAYFAIVGLHTLNSEKAIVTVQMYYEMKE